RFRRGVRDRTRHEGDGASPRRPGGLPGDLLQVRRGDCRRARPVRHRRTGDLSYRARQHRARWNGELQGGQVMARALDGIVVADFTHVMTDPFATHLARPLGARVIEIEVPTGGYALRYYGHVRRYDSMSPAFIAVNAGKERMALDLKEEGQLAIARDIA